jgi:hypothetical protein
VKVLIHQDVFFGPIGAWAVDPANPSGPPRSWYVTGSPELAKRENYGQSLMAAKGPGCTWDEWFDGLQNATPSRTYWVLMEAPDGSALSEVVRAALLG